MKGKWKNEQGGSYGDFSCTQTSSSLSSATLVCDSCKRVIPTGAIRWNCTICSPDWNCCSQCLATTPSNPLSSSPTRVDPPTALHPHTLESEQVYSSEVAGGESCAQLVHNALLIFASRPLLGQRESTNTSTFAWLTYGQVGEFAQDAAWGLRDLIQQYEVTSGKRKREEENSAPTPLSGCVALCAENSPPYVAAMLAGVLVESIVVPIHPVLDTPSVLHILAKTTPLAFFVGEEYVEKLQTILANVPNVVVLPRMLTSTGDTKSSFLSFRALCEMGRKIREAEQNKLGVPNLPTLSLPPPPSPTTVRAVLFTSGSTGMPKGAMYTEKLLRPTERTSPSHPFLRFDFQTFHPSFLLSLLQTMHLGGRRVAAVNLTTIMEDLSLARPSHVSATPLFWNSLMQDCILDDSKKQFDRPNFIK